MPKFAAKKTLTDAACRRFKAPATGRDDHWDAAQDGLALRITPNDVRSWVVMKRIKGGPVARITLGRFPDFSLAAARREAAELVETMNRGIDPRRERQEHQRKQNDRDALTYEQAVAEYITKFQIGKKGNRRWRETQRLLLTTAGKLKGKPLASITRRQVHNVLDAIMAEGKGYAANRTFAALKTFFGWCTSRDMLDRNPMDGIDRPFDGEKARERSWSDDEIKALWKAADELGEIQGPYLKVLILVGQRRGEVAEMKRGHLEADGSLWRLPSANAKGKREHVFPLARLTQRIIESVPELVTKAADQPQQTDTCPLVFPGRSGKVIAGWSKMQATVQKQSGVADFGFHQARHTLRTGLDRLGIPPHIKDECLNHARQGVGDRHYSHYTYLDEQREAFEAWAAHVQRVVYGDNVEVLRG